MGKPGGRPTPRFVEPVLDLATIEQQEKRKSLQEEITKLEQTLETQTPELDGAQLEWEHLQPAIQSQWKTLEPQEYSSAGGAVLSKAYDDNVSLRVSGPNPESDTYVIVAKSDLPGIKAFQLEVLPDLSQAGLGAGRSKNGEFVLTRFRVEVVKGRQKPETVEFSKAKADFSADGFPVSNAIDENRETGWALMPHAGEAHQAVFENKHPLGAGEELTLIFTLAHESKALYHNIARFRLSVTNIKDSAPAALAPLNVQRILGIPTGKRTAEQKTELSSYYRSIAPFLSSARRRLRQLNKELNDLGIVSTLVMRERPSFDRPSTLLRNRGSFINQGEKVYASVPAVLHPLPEGTMPNRLGLAHWLVDPANPLVARVTVNRTWAQYFGRGLVETTEDFGTKGERPSHPETLDWLATEFIRQRWSMKAIHRLIVSSATYRQSSSVKPALLERDPYNRLLARGPRFRMEAEMVRDVALSASGLLCQTIGGPSVFPYQPPGVWSLPYNNDQWVMSEGGDRYRRGMYTFWRRTAPYPSLMSFDATSGEFCTPKRNRSNTPLQALTTLNDPAFFEAAQVLARKIHSRSVGNAQEKAIYGFRRCTSRKPAPEEIAALLSFYEQERKRFSQDKAAACRLIGEPRSPAEESEVAELAAWTMVSNVLLNMDQTLTKE